MTNENSAFKQPVDMLLLTSCGLCLLLFRGIRWEETKKIKAKAIESGIVWIQESIKSRDWNCEARESQQFLPEKETIDRVTALARQQLYISLSAPSRAWSTPDVQFVHVFDYKYGC